MRAATGSTCLVCAGHVTTRPHPSNPTAFLFSFFSECTESTCKSKTKQNKKEYSTGENKHILIFTKQCDIKNKNINEEIIFSGESNYFINQIIQIILREKLKKKESFKFTVCYAKLLRY